MEQFSDITVIIPSLDPDEKLHQVIRGVMEQGFSDILLVDDGSAPENQHYFSDAESQFGCTVLHHAHNRGKGRALKTAFAWYEQNRPDSRGCVTVDGDNQHHPLDIKACVEVMLHDDCRSLVLGVRNFNGDDVPRKSRFGNHATSFVFRVFCGLKVSDTQTGLRVFPKSSMPLMLKIDGERFEYETNMLLSCKNAGLPIKEQTIRTIYINDNATTHFHPIKDSIKVYGIILKFFASSIASFLLDNALFNLLYALTKSLPISYIARIVSSLFNYAVNRKAVFKSEAPLLQTTIRYYVLCACQLLASMGLVALFSHTVSSSQGMVAVIKIIVDIFLYFISFRIQQAWVFAEKPTFSEKE